MRTAASSLRTRSAIVSSLHPPVSKAFVSRPCGAIARTSSNWRCLSVRGSVAILASHGGVGALPACAEPKPFAESLVSKRRAADAWLENRSERVIYVQSTWRRWPRRAVGQLDKQAKARPLGGADFCSHVGR